MINRIEFSATNLSSNAGLLLLLEHPRKNGVFDLGNLDTKTGTSIMELLERSCREMNQTVIVVTHDPRAASYAQRVIFLRDGDIVKEYQPGINVPLVDRMNGIISTMQELES